MSKAVSQRGRRTYFNKPLIEESLRHLPAALHHPTSVAFRAYLIEKLHQSGAATRNRFAQYIAQRFSHNGHMNLDLACAVAQFGDSRTGREILYFEMLQAVPVLQEVASLWLSQQPSEGGTRASLLSFLESRLGSGKSRGVASATLTTFRQCRKMTSPKPGLYVPVWAEPPLEAFLYVLARLYPERAMVRVELFAGLPVIRALLWPRPALVPLLEAARDAGHISKISELDQYHQFTLAGSGQERLDLLLQGNHTTPPGSASSHRHTAMPVGEQLWLLS